MDDHVESMKFEVLQENLNRCLSLITRVIVSKPQLPILSNVFVSAKNGKLTFTASNLETSILIETGAKIEVEGDFTVPGRTFFEIIASLSAQKIMFEVTNGSATIKSSGFSARINGVAASEYPPLFVQSATKDSIFWQISKESFLRALQMTIFAAASDEGRAALTGVLLAPKDDGLTLAATDGFRLSVVHLEKLGTSNQATVDPMIIPARSLAEFVHLASEKKTDKEGNPETIKIFLAPNEKQVYFGMDDVKIFSSLVAGNFPDYEKIIPSKLTLKVVTTAEELSKSVRLAAIFARESANIVKLHIAHSKLLISANAAQIGENESQVDVKVEGEDKDQEFSIAFNFHYLLDFLATTSGEVTMEFSGPTAPGVFKTTTQNFLHLIMPVRVQK